MRRSVDNKDVSSFEDEQQRATVGFAANSKPWDARQPAARPASSTVSEHPGVVAIDCPSLLVADGLARALENAHVRYRQGPPEAGVPCTVVLWAEDAKSVLSKVERTREVSPDASILVLGPSADLPLARAAFRVGARGFVHAGMRPEQVARAIEVAARGEIVAPRELLEHLLADEEPADLGVLSSRQQEVLGLVAEGMSNAQIAKRLFLSESTVKQHLRSAYKLLGVTNRTEAARLLRNASEHRVRISGSVTD